MTTTEPTQALLPCPFCGSDELSYGHNYAGIHWAQVECHNDACQAHVFAETEAEAIAAWNTRAHQPHPVDAILYNEAAINAVQTLLEKGKAIVDSDGYLKLVQLIQPVDVERDWWKSDPEDPFWMLEAEDGEWLKNAASLLGTRDASKAIRFPREIDAYSHPARMTAGTKWWSAKPTEHKWVAGAAISAMQGADGKGALTDALKTADKLARRMGARFVPNEAMPANSGEEV